MYNPEMHEITQVLQSMDRGDAGASAKLLPLVYEELRRLAAARMAQEGADLTLQATALVHEAYLRLVSPNEQTVWDNRGHFFAAAAEAMRRILVERARRTARVRHGGEVRRVELFDVPAPTPDERILALDNALSRLALEDPLAARVVELRHFGGLGHGDIAGLLDTTVYAVRQKWTYARAWLRVELGGEI